MSELNSWSLLLTVVPNETCPKCTLNAYWLSVSPPAQDVLGAPGDRCVGVPGAGAHHSAGSSHLLQCDDRGDLCFLHPRRNPQQLHLGPATYRYTAYCFRLIVCLTWSEWELDTSLLFVFLTCKLQLKAVIKSKFFIHWMSSDKILKLKRKICSKSGVHSHSWELKICQNIWEEKWRGQISNRRARNQDWRSKNVLLKLWTHAFTCGLKEA